MHRQLTRLARCGWLLACVFSSGARCEEFAKPPVFPDEVKNVFYDDAFKALSGPRPVGEAPPSENSPVAASSADDAWKTLIDGETLTTEIKRTINRLPALVKNPSTFSTRSHNDCRREFTTLAVLFDIESRYPDELRWKEYSRVLSRQCASSAESCEEGSPEALTVAREVTVTLGDLLRGQSPVAEDNQRPSADATPAFAPLMKRLDTSVKDNLPPLLTDQRAFRKGASLVSEEAQLLAVFSQVIRGEEYGYADDETYQGHADALRDSAVRLREAATSQDFAKAVEAATEISQACAKCHADYRG